MSHLGRPKGERVEKLSLKPVAEYLRNKLELPVKFISETVGETVGETVKIAATELQPREILLLENLRFQPAETKNDEVFAQQLATLADIYINEAFSASHRTHTSIVGVAKLLPAFAGFHLQKEVENLQRLMDRPEHPFVMIIGGAKNFR